MFVTYVRQKHYPLYQLGNQRTGSADLSSCCGGLGPNTQSVTYLLRGQLTVLFCAGIIFGCELEKQGKHRPLALRITLMFKQKHSFMEHKEDILSIFVFFWQFKSQLFFAKKIILKSCACKNIFTFSRGVCVILLTIMK